MSFIGSNIFSRDGAFLNPEPVKSGDQWSKYPAVSDVNMNNFNIDNANNITAQNIIATEKEVENLTILNTLEVGGDTSLHAVDLVGDLTTANKILFSPNTDREMVFYGTDLNTGIQLDTNEALNLRISDQNFGLGTETDIACLTVGAINLYRDTTCHNNLDVGGAITATGNIDCSQLIANTGDVALGFDIGGTATINFLRVSNGSRFDNGGAVSLTTTGTTVGSRLNSKTYSIASGVNQNMLKHDTAQDATIIENVLQPVDATAQSGAFTLNLYAISTSRTITLQAPGGTYDINIYENETTGTNFNNAPFTHFIAVNKAGGSWTIRVNLLQRNGTASTKKFIYTDASSGSIVGRNKVQTVSFTTPASYHALTITACGDASVSDNYYYVKYE